MTSADENVDIISEMCRDAILYAATPKDKCVGIKLFTEPCQLDENDNVAMDELESYVDHCVEKALDLKTSVECGICDINKNNHIDLNPSTSCVNIESFIALRAKELQESLLLKHENLLIQLGRQMISAFQIGHIDYAVGEICLAEIHGLSIKTLTPLMLKKNPQIVQSMAKLCRFMDANCSMDDQDMHLKRCQNIQKCAKIILKKFKALMGFNGNNDDFLHWFTESVKLFHELTADLTDEARRKLILDPEEIISSRIL